MREQGKNVKPIEVPVSAEEMILDELILKYPFDLRSSYLWYLLRMRGLVGCRCCCCCCCCAPGAPGVPGAPGAPGAPGVPGAPGSPSPAPNIQVTLSAMGYSLVVGGTYSVRVEVEWSATVSSNLSVDIQVRSQLVIGSYRDWTTIYSNRPASGREAWPAAAAPLLKRWLLGTHQGAVTTTSHLQFRAVAEDPAGNQGISNVVTI